MEKIKATKNTAKDVETLKPPKPLNPIIYEIPEPLLQVTINYIANSIPRGITVQDSVNLINTLQRLKKKE